MPRSESYFLTDQALMFGDPPLKGALRAEVCIIGGGMSGISVALHLAEAGLSTALLEARHVGWGATGRSAGHLVSGYLPGPNDMIATLGGEHALELQRLANTGKEALKERIRSAQISCDFRPGYVFVGRRPSHPATLRAMADFWKEQLGITSVRFLSGSELRDHVRSPLYQSGLFDPTGASLDPVKLLVALAAALRDHGGRIFGNSTARRISVQSDNRILVETDSGSVTADHVVLCANADPDEPHLAMRSYVMPVASSVIATERLDASVIAQILPTRLAGSDWRMAPDYWTVTADNRLLFGRGGFHLRPPTSGHPSGPTRRLARIFPALDGVKVDNFWQGTVAATRMLLPQIGRIDRNLWVARGYNGVGLALAYLAGSLIADAIAGRPGAVEAFERIPHRRFPAGLYGLPVQFLHAMRAWARDLV